MWSYDLTCVFLRRNIHMAVHCTPVYESRVNSR